MDVKDKKVTKEIIQQFFISGAYAKEHSTNNFFVKDDILYCKKCNLPMRFISHILYYRCQGCGKYVSLKKK